MEIKIFLKGIKFKTDKWHLFKLKLFSYYLIFEFME